LPETLLVVDAFTAEPFKGNPAGVCLLPSERPESWMQKVAAELNLSETAFLAPRPDGFGLRWFTPTTEVPLCGHATLASAHALWQTGRLPETEQARFHTRHSGLLTARRAGKRIEMDFPAIASEPATLPQDARAGLGVTPLDSALTESVGEQNYIVELESEAAVRAVTPDFGFLRKFPQGVIVTARGTPPYDFVSRYFAAWWGIDEDPVTGSAHCGLAPYWSARLGKSAMTGFQCSARGGVVQVEVRGKRVALSGEAVTVLRAELLA
jgi:PhzF family phenazine biosynthesis protein